MDLDAYTEGMPSTVAPLFDSTPAGMLQQVCRSMRFLEAEFDRIKDPRRRMVMDRAYRKLVGEIAALKPDGAQ